MASRYPVVKSSHYCFHPRLIFQNGTELLVPCGKCDGCLLHKANDWSMRLGSDIEANRNSIFFTLTYNNKYIPYAIPITAHTFAVNHPFNIRYDSVKDKEREEDFQYLFSSSPVPITNGRLDCIPYLSKRDIQLWLKSLRKSIDLNFKLHGTDNNIRYFIVGEYGPTKYRPHYHGVIIAQSHEVSEFLIHSALYQNWKMCDKSLFDKYTHYCDSGAKGYVTQYLTSFANLPKVYQSKEIKPFRLASKRTATGTTAFNFAEVFQNVLDGNIEYVKQVPRIGEQYIFRYPKEIANTLFPKCYRYSELSFDGLLRVYGRLYTIRRKFPTHFCIVFDRLYPELHASDINATKVCMKWCDKFEISPFVYVYALDMFYYKCNMVTLKNWYDSQDVVLKGFDALKEYSNFGIKCLQYRIGALSPIQVRNFRWFCESFGVHLDDIDLLTSREIDDMLKYTPSDEYVLSVQDVIANAVKMPKYNELTGQSPHIV